MNNKISFFYKACESFVLFTGIFLSQTTIVTAQGLPIKPTRTVSFTTNEGSYMNVDISPDGKSLAFDLLGDLYCVPIAGGKASQLTRGIALNLHPVWSPDGKKLAFLTDRSGDFHLCILDLLNKRNILLGSKAISYDDYLSSDIQWTPDGYYVKLGGNIYSIVGGRLPKQPSKQNPTKFLSNDIVYDIEEKKIYRNNKKANAWDLIEILPQQAHSVLLSPDKNKVAFIADTNSVRCLIIENLFSKQKRILAPLTLIDSNYKSDPIQHFSFSSNSKLIYISYGGKIHRIDVDSNSDQTIPFTANVNVYMGPLNHNSHQIDHGAFNVMYTRSANASSDGKRLVFSALGKVWIMDLPNGKAHLLADQPFNQFQPIFSPDSKWVTYVSWCDTTGGQLWKVSVNGYKPVCLTTSPAEYYCPTWSPDGTQVAVIRGGAGNLDKTQRYSQGEGLPSLLDDREDPGSGQIQIISLKDNSVRSLVDSVPLYNNQLLFSTHGESIIYAPRFTKVGGIVHFLISKTLKDNKSTTVAVGAYKDIYLAKRSLSPDGRYAAYAEDEDVYLLPLYSFDRTPQVSAYDRLQDDRIPIIRFSAGVDPYWEKGGKILAWSYGNKFYRIDPDKIMAAAEQKLEKLSFVPENDFTSVNITPDETIAINLSSRCNYAHGIIALMNAKIVTMQGNKIIKKGTLLIKDGRFLAIGPTNKVKVPINAKTYDLNGKTVIPGLIDLHLHMRVPPDVFPQQSNLLLANLAYGVTTARDPSANIDQFGYAELLRSGRMLGPRLITVGRAIRFIDGVTRLDNLEDAERVVKKRMLFGGTEIKQYTLNTRLQREWLSMACREYGLNMTNEGADDPVLQLAMLKDGSTGIEHNPAFGDVYKDIIKLYTESGSYLTPVLQVAYGTEEAKEYFKQVYWHHADEKMERFKVSDTTQKVPKPKGNGDETLQTILWARSQDTIHPGFLAPAHIDTRILRAGGKITMGSHGNDEGIGPHNEIWALQMGGFTNMEALRAATLSGAEALGIQKDVGSIEVGKMADLVILNSNPLENIHNTRDIKYVMKDGILYDGDTLDELWPVKKKCPAWTSKNMAVQSAEVQGLTWDKTTKKLIKKSN